MLLIGYKRRAFIKNSLSASSLLCVPGLMAETLSLTPHQTEGPFYPDKMPLDTDNDLIILNDSLTPAVGTVAYLSGKVTDIKGNPLRNTLVEIWQVDNNGVYLHTKGGSRAKLDSNFQGYGRFLTDSKGNYFFRTLKPSPYSGRTPHIHIAVSAKGQKKFTNKDRISRSFSALPAPRLKSMKIFQKTLLKSLRPGYRFLSQPCPWPGSARLTVIMVCFP